MRGQRVPRTIAAACAAAGLAVVAATWWAVGRQHIAAQWQFPVVAAGLGVGLVFVAGLLYAATRRREGEWRVEEALARLLVASASVPPQLSARSRQAHADATEELPVVGSPRAVRPER